MKKEKKSKWYYKIWSYHQTGQYKLEKAFFRYGIESGYLYLDKYVCFLGQAMVQFRTPSDTLQTKA